MSHHLDYVRIHSQFALIGSLDTSQCHGLQVGFGRDSLRLLEKEALYNSLMKPTPNEKEVGKDFFVWLDNKVKG
jgi:hypothetical protein